MSGEIVPTHFASAERATPEIITSEHRGLASQPLIKQLLDGFPEPAMILNKQRQIVMANDKLLALLNQSQDRLLGKRPGEAVNCIHWNKERGGCGTTQFCRTCGAVGAILASQDSRTPAVQECRITSATPEGDAPLDLRVWATPVTIDQDFTIFAIRDISDQKRRRVLERMFFHDILNTAGTLHGVAEIWPELPHEKAKRMSQMARRLANDLVEQIQSGRDLAAAESGELEVDLEDLEAHGLLAGLAATFRHHEVSEGKTIVTPLGAYPVAIRSDKVLLQRVLGNLIKNALEATIPGQTVSLWFENLDVPTFVVHNESVMPEDVKLQIFQRSFSTKEGKGRGVGTYSVKLLTERYLNGKVEFTSSDDGTTFAVKLPR